MRENVMIGANLLFGLLIEVPQKNIFRLWDYNWDIRKVNAWNLVKTIKQDLLWQSNSHNDFHIREYDDYRCDIGKMISVSGFSYVVDAIYHYQFSFVIDQIFTYIPIIQRLSLHWDAYEVNAENHISNCSRWACFIKLIMSRETLMENKLNEEIELMLPWSGGERVRSWVGL